MRASKTFKTAQDAVADDENLIYAAIYVFDGRYQNEPAVQGYDAASVVYADRTSDRVRVGRKSYDVVTRLIGCGANRVSCIFTFSAHIATGN